MKLTKQTDYAFRILMFCAAGGNRLCRVADVARAYGASEAFLFKILNPLVEAGLVETVRGRNGGIRLARPADQITLADVARVTEDTFDMAECFEGSDVDCPLVDNCQLTTALRRALGAFFEVLEDVTIDDLSKPSAAVTQLLSMIENAPKAPDAAVS